jgi:formamidopyrimidine-DNA glycosylase
MDQTVISGIGNIYADESLFCAGISPLRLAKDISRTELTGLISCIRSILKKGLEYGGSSENTYVNIEGKKGEMQNHFQIYRKTGKPCPNKCGIVKRTVVGGRGTHYCPDCQK